VSDTVADVEPVDALSEIASLLERTREPYFKVRAFRSAAKAVRDISRGELERLAELQRLADIPGVGESSAKVIAEALSDQVPAYLQRLRGVFENPGSDAGRALRQLLRGDLHLHSDWSDGGDTPHDMAAKAKAIGHDYIALTDHSPRLKIAHGLTAERLREQLDVVAEINDRYAPFRMLTGIEVDINEDGSLDQDEDLLAEVDVVVASVHSKLAMPRAEMTDRMLRALAHPHTDILGHCTGRMVTGRGRAESEFDPDLVFMAAKKFDKAIEINCRPERLDPPRRMLRRIVELEVKVAIDTDAHAVDQLEWQPFGCDRAVECEVPVESIVNAWPLDRLLTWTAGHTAGMTTF
jgi:putative hydrolase